MRETNGMLEQLMKLETSTTNATRNLQLEVRSIRSELQNRSECELSFSSTISVIQFSNYLQIMNATVAMSFINQIPGSQDYTAYRIPVSLSEGYYQTILCYRGNGERL